MKTTFLFCAALLLASAPAYAVTDDGFGGSTYFTATAPSALGDAAPSTAFAADDMDADEISKIEPAAGGDDVFTLPDDPAAVVPVAPTKDGEHLMAPEAPVVPGMTAPQAPVKN